MQQTQRGQAAQTQPVPSNAVTDEQFTRTELAQTLGELVKLGLIESERCLTDDGEGIMTVYQLLVVPS